MKNICVKSGNGLFHEMIVIKLFRSQGCHFCLQYFTVHITRFGLGIRDCRNSLPKMHFLIPKGIPCHIHLHVNANRQVRCAATGDGCRCGNVAGNGVKFSYANAKPYFEINTLKYKKLEPCLRNKLTAFI